MKRYSILAACALLSVTGCGPDDDEARDGEGMAQVVVSIDASITGVTKPITGRYNGTPFSATLVISRFADEAGAIVGYADLSKPAGGLAPEALQALATQEIRLPIFLLPTESDAGVPDAGLSGGLDGGLSCPLLSLVLQPLRVDLAGAVVELDKVDLGVKARSGTGMLLGNVLCGVAGQLGPNGQLIGLHPEITGQLVGFLNGLAGGIIEGIKDGIGSRAPARI